MGVNMQLRHAVAARFLALALPLASSSAQTTAPSTQTTAPDAATWSFSLGVDPTSLNSHTPVSGVDPRMVANLTRSWQSAQSRWGRRISLMVGTDTPREVQPAIFAPGGPCTDCAMDVTSRYAGFTAGATYDLFRVSRFTPYLAGGTGIYYTTLSRSPADGILTPSELALYQNGGFYQHNFSVGVNAGLGLKVRLGSHELFIEQMVHRFDIGTLGVGINPLNIGIRF
jgi:ABC-type transport system substrate-binding protein